MGKKSLIKSTAKKRPAKKTAPAEQTETKPPVKKNAPAEQPTTQSKPARKPAAAPKATVVSMRDILKRQYSAEIPKTRYTSPAKVIEKPALASSDPYAGMDATAVDRIKQLLSNTYTEAQLKAAAERAAAERAAAEQAAAERAAAERAAAEKPGVQVTYDPPPVQTAVDKPSDPVDTSLKLVAAGLAFLILLVVWASVSNSSRYVLIENQGTLEIWKGRFAPKGKEMVIALPGITAPQPPKAVYRSSEVYPLVFGFYIEKADALLDVPGIPDFEAIQTTLKNAEAYVSTKALQSIVDERLNTIDRLILTYRAEVAAGRGAIDDLTSAIGFLKAAAKLTSNPTQATVIAQKIADHEARVIELEEMAAAEQATSARADHE